MLLIIGIVLVVVAAIQIYKAANSTGRNGALWAIITVALGVGLQVIIPVVLGMIMGVAYIMSGTPPEEIQDKITGPAIVITIVALLLSFLGVWLIFRHVSKVTDDGRAENVPPPPTFGENA